MTAGSLRGRNLGLISFGIILLLSMIAVPLLANASSFSAGLTVEHSGDRIQNDLYVAALRAEITADVQGDVSLAAGTATLDSNVGGSVHVLSGSATIRGEIDGSLYVAGGVVRLDGEVHGNVVVAGGRLELKDNATIGGDLILYSAQAQVDGDVSGKLYGSTLLYDQNGSVSGNLELQSDRIKIGENATIGDDFRYQSQVDASVHVNAQIGGANDRTNASPWNGIGDGAMAPFGQMLRLVWSMLAGAALIVLAPRLFYKAAENGASIVSSGIWGTLGLVLLPVLAILLLLSVLLLPVGMLLMLLVPFALYLSQIVVGITIGRAILPRKWRDGSRGFLLFAMVLGLIVIGVLRMAPVPFLNVVVVVLVSVWGFGALLQVLKDLNSSKTRESMIR